MATIYVDADHVAASNAWTRAEAADDPTKPFLGTQPAAALLQAGDTLHVKPSTLGNADPAGIDPNMYTGVSHDANTIVLPAANNGAGATINVVGEIVGGVRPKVRSFDFFELNNWSFEGFQKGYDRGGGNDFDTVSGLQNCTDLTFTNILSTGGGWNCIAGNGTMLWEDCITYSPFQEGNPHFLNGVGFHILGLNTGTGENTIGDWKFINCYFEQVEGEDCIQVALGEPSAATALERGGTIEIRGCTFKDITLNPALANPIHTDCIQPLGCLEVLVIKNIFINCFQPMLASDHENGRIVCIGNIVDGCQNGLWLQGTNEAYYAHNTIKSLFSGIAIGRRLNETQPDFVTKLTIINNVITSLSFDPAESEVDPTSVVTNNVCYLAPGQVTPWGTQLPGLPEFGGSARLVAEGVVTGNVSDWGDPSGTMELSNSPVESAGIGDGRVVTGLGFTAGELTDLATDALGRAFATPRDCGALQSDPGTLILPAPRPPYVLNRTPSPDSSGVSPATDVTFTLVPPPGQQIDPATVTTATVYVKDATDFIQIPSRVTLSDMVDGAQNVVLELFALINPDVEGVLHPLVLYTASIEGVGDTQGSEIGLLSWSFRIAGTGTAAVSPADGASATVVSGGFLLDAFTRALIVKAI